MPEKSSLLRRPRPPKVEKTVRVLVSVNHQDSFFSNRYPLRTRSHDLSSPVPTVQSGYEPNKFMKQREIGHQFTRNDVATQSDAGLVGHSLGPPSVVMPYKVQGPDPFPVRLPRQPLEIKHEYIIPDDTYYQKEPEFCLEDFMLTNELAPTPAPPPQKLIVSNANYQKLSNMLQKSTQTSTTPEMSKIDLEEQFFSLPRKVNRVPKRQTLLQMENAVQHRLEAIGITSPTTFRREVAKVEEMFEEMQQCEDMQVIGVKSQMSLITRASNRVFKEAKKSEMLRKNTKESDSLITPSELSILNCLMDGGFILSLKAHFASDIPDLSPLYSSLIYLNLSFNELDDFPTDILNCSNLHVLKFRDNPLRGLPADIARLRHLRTLIISFCCLKSLPLGLFSIKTLEYLDVSYNKLTSIPSDIKHLDNLRFLNVEGNELPGLPCGLLRVNLFRIRIRNNLMSPVFWKENSTNTPQRLSDLCCHVLQENFVQEKPENYKKFDIEIVKQLTKFGRCDCCRGPMYGSGLLIIRPCTEIWKIRRLPFIFRSCSPTCYHTFVRNTDPKIADLIYGISDNESV